MFFRNVSNNVSNNTAAQTALESEMINQRTREQCLELIEQSIKDVHCHIDANATRSFRSLQRFQEDIDVLAATMGVRLETVPEKRVAIPLEGCTTAREHLASEVSAALAEAAEEVADDMTEFDVRIRRVEDALANLSQQFSNAFAGRQAPKKK